VSNCANSGVQVQLGGLASGWCWCVAHAAQPRLIHLHSRAFGWGKVNGGRLEPEITRAIQRHWTQSCWRNGYPHARQYGRARCNPNSQQAAIC